MGFPYRTKHGAQLFDTTNGYPPTQGLSNPGPITQGNSGTSPPTAPSRATTPLDNFKRSIKRDPSAYPTIKDHAKWDNWNRSLIAQARVDDVSDILDPTYIPITDTDKDLFRVKQSYLYNVFNKCILTDLGQKLVRTYAETFDAQKIYKALIDHAQASTAAELKKEALMVYVTTARLDSTWRGDTEGFILHWHEQIRLLESLQPIAEHHTEAAKLALLQAAVSPVPELLSIKDLENNRVASGGTPLKFDGYVALLMSAAVQRDAKLKLPGQRSKRIVNTHDYTYNDSSDDPFTEGYIDAGIDFFNYDLQVNRTDIVATQQPTSTYIAPEIWSKIPSQYQDLIRIHCNAQSTNSQTPYSETYYQFP